MRQYKKAYEQGGTIAVCDLANKNNHKEWGYCKDCGATLPMQDGQCLACGTSKTFIYSTIAIAGQCPICQSDNVECYGFCSGVSGQSKMNCEECGTNFAEWYSNDFIGQTCDEHSLDINVEKRELIIFQHLIEACKMSIEALKDHVQYDNPDEPDSLELIALNASQDAIAKAIEK